jgi:hypothetical protein
MEKSKKSTEVEPVAYEGAVAATAKTPGWFDVIVMVHDPVSLVVHDDADRVPPIVEKETMMP